MVLVLFDIDGTLITSGGTGRKAIAKALSEFCGVEIDMSKVALGGRTDPAIVRDCLRLGGFSEQEIPRLIPDCLAIYADELERAIRPEHVTLLPGVQTLLDQLSLHSDYSLGLITGNLKNTAYMKLGAGQISSYFPCGGFGSDHEDRNMLPRFARDRANTHYERTFSPIKTIVIGDTQHDVSCSRHFGAWALAVSTGMCSYELLASCEPDLLVTDLSKTELIWPFFESVLDA
ncbi:MAG: HAD hydrolase-like protein [Bacteroidetes bacterium]|nr:HAD hydrolase-like protein [Bacteroidota bacterium]